MSKKSKKFENLNAIKTSSTEDILMNEYIEGLNSRLSYIEKHFPISWKHFFSVEVAKKFERKTIENDRSKKAVRIIKIIFDNLGIMEESSDLEEIERLKAQLNIKALAKSFDTSVLGDNCIELEDLAKLAAIYLRNERQKANLTKFLAPAGFANLFKFKSLVEDLNKDDGFLETQRNTISYPQTKLAQKKYLKNGGSKPVYFYLYYSDYLTFCYKFMRAKGFKGASETLLIINNGIESQREIAVNNDILYSSFLTYIALEELLEVTAQFEKEYFGMKKRRLAEFGSSVSKYLEFFIDFSLADRLRTVIREIQMETPFRVKDEFNHSLLQLFLDGKSDSVLIPLIVFRHIYITGQCTQNDFMQTTVQDRNQQRLEIAFLMTRKILAWCEQKFVQSMKYFLNDIGP
ncbi:MAG: hypothetical protein CBC42_01305 [Betaproteobacteria bacterium TMED82]|nr:MAG: hypothetical protein CBC42_01305 [Betaproteobacteria bacterium TMED82]|tara:strand:- start:9994 stop:11205 length:1212 start_codon:yes stop_codon:yes gene_type:complete